MAELPDFNWRSLRPRFLSPGRKKAAKARGGQKPSVEDLEGRLVLSGDIVIPQHASHIRVTELAYGGTPITEDYEQDLLRNNVDLVVANKLYLEGIDAVAPGTPQLIYTNVSNLSQDDDQQTLNDWLEYADTEGVSREDAFYHVTTALRYSAAVKPGENSTKAVDWFWGVYSGPNVGTLTDETSDARDTDINDVDFGTASDAAVYVGYVEKFREININVTTAAGSSWSYRLEYSTGVDGNGDPTWVHLATPLTTDSLRSVGQKQITFHPPTDWKTVKLGDAPRLFYIRLVTTSTGQSPEESAPQASRILGRNYVGYTDADPQRGIIPAFDQNADINDDGYLDTSEWEAKAEGKDARFLYESRLIYIAHDNDDEVNPGIASYYGQMRFLTDPGSNHFATWARNYNLALLNKPEHEHADGLFVDNSPGTHQVDLTRQGGLTLVSLDKSLTSYSSDYASLLSDIRAAISAERDRWLLPNTEASDSGDTYADQVILATGTYFQEFALEPLYDTWVDFEATASREAHRAALTIPAPFAVLGSNPRHRPLQGAADPTDSRTQLTTLAYYYLLADPASTFLNLYGGVEAASSWTRHWAGAAAFDIGQPTGTWSLFASGQDPDDNALDYHVYQRDYGNALVLYKPLSTDEEDFGDLEGTATTHPLGGWYYVLGADGTLERNDDGTLRLVNSVPLRNGEGVILVKRLGVSDTFTQSAARELGAAPWVVVNGGDLRPVDGQIRAYATSLAVVNTHTDTPLTDVAVEADVQVPDGGTAGVVAHYTTTNNHVSAKYYLGLLERSGSSLSVRIREHDNGSWSDVLSPVAITADASAFHRLRLEVTTNPSNVEFRVFVDGVEVTAAHVTDGSNPLAAGRVGLRGLEGSYFDNYHASALGTKTVYAREDFSRDDALDWTPWTVVNSGSASFTVDDGKVKVASGSPVAVFKNVRAADVAVEADVNVAANSTAGLVARYQDSGDQYVALLYRASATEYIATIRKVPASGSPIDLAENPDVELDDLASHRVRFEAVGGTLRLYVDGVLLAEGIDDDPLDGDPLGAGKVGLYGGAAGTTFDNLTMTELTAPAALPFADTFTAPDGAALSGWQWLPTAGAFEVTGGKAAAQVAGTNIATLYGVWQADVGISADVALTQTGDSGGVVARHSGFGSTESYYAGVLRRVDSDTTYAEIWKVHNGVTTTLSFVDVDDVLGGRLYFEVVGATLTLSVDGVLRATATDVSVLSGGTVGVLADPTAAGGANIDNFQLGWTVLRDADTFTQSGASLDGARWTNATGTFMVAGGRAVADSGTPVAVIDDLDLTDVAVEADVDVASGTSARLVARYQGPDDDNYYMGYLYRDGATNYSVGIQKIGLNGNVLLHIAADAPVQLANLSGQHHLRFEAVGTNLRLYVDGVLLAAGDDTSTSPFTSGKVGISGFVSGSNKPALDNVRVSTPGLLSRGLFAGDTFAQTNGTSLNPASWTVVNYSGGSNDFEVQSGRAEVEDGSPVAVFNDLTVTDVAVEADVTVVVNRSARLVARYRGIGGTADANYYVGILYRDPGGAGNNFQFSIVEVGPAGTAVATWNGDDAVLSDAAGSHRMRFEAVGNTLRLYVDGALRVSATDASFTDGKAGIASWSGGVTYDNVRVWAPTSLSSDTFAQVNNTLLDAARWQEVNGTANFKVTGGAAAVDDGGPVAVVRDFSASHVAVEADVTVVPNSSARLIARYQGDGTGTGNKNYYVAVFYRSGAPSDHNFVVNIQKVGATSGSTVVGTGWTPTLTDPDATYHLRFEVVGNTVTTLNLYVDGVLRAFGTDTTDPFLSGRVGISAFAAGPTYDNFRAVRLEGFFTDSFTQADGPLGQSWANAGSSFTVVGGKARGKAAGSVATVVGYAVADVSVSAQVTVTGTGTAGVVARYRDSRNYYAAVIEYDVVNSVAGYYARIYRYINGSPGSPLLEELVGTDTSFSGQLQLEVLGDSLALYVNGELVDAVIDANPLDGPGGVGIFASDGEEVDDFTAFLI